MRKINENDSKNYTIIGPGWTYNVESFANANRVWADCSGTGLTFYGNKHNGDRSIIDSK